MKMICDTDSVWSRFILRELETLNDESRKNIIKENGRKKEIEEKEWSEFMDMTTAVSEVDAEYYKSIAKDSNRVKLFSNVLDLNEYLIKPKPPVNIKKPCMYLAGTFWRGSPMEQAARWVIHDVLPIIIKTIPGIHFYIVGIDSDKILADINDPNITVMGKLYSVLPYLCNADVSLVPLKYESGTRFKILEAGACGIPIVSTTLGAEGIPVTHGYDILIADEPEEFAESIVKIITDKQLSNKLSNNCKDLIQKNYSVNSLMDEANEIINYLTVNND
jgi:glycosyltransferase involved in cell wall biosynthesis